MIIKLIKACAFCKSVTLWKEECVREIETERDGRGENLYQWLRELTHCLQTSTERGSVWVWKINCVVFLTALLSKWPNNIRQVIISPLEIRERQLNAKSSKQHTARQLSDRKINIQETERLRASTTWHTINISHWGAKSWLQ